MQEKESFDVVIVGGGPAGISAALWSSELGLKTVLVEAKSTLGGQLNWTFNEITNYLGVSVSNGEELKDKFLENLDQGRISVNSNFEVSDIDVEKKNISSSEGERISFRALVLATGVRRRHLDIPGEEKFQGKGILTSGKKERSLVAGKTVVIVGGGDAAFENIRILADTAQNVYLVHRRRGFRARREFVAFAQDCPKVEILTNSVIIEVSGDEAVESVAIRNLKTGEESRLNTDAVLIRIGVQPNTDFLQDRVAVDNEGYIQINEVCETKSPQIFAIGDVANPLSPTINSAAGMGATAAKVIYSKLR